MQCRVVILVPELEILIKTVSGRLKLFSTGDLNKNKFHKIKKVLSRLKSIK